MVNSILNLFFHFCLLMCLLISCFCMGYLQIVPGYYLRRNVNGQIENSAAMNNTASEHFMVDRLIVDDLLNWAINYKVSCDNNIALLAHHIFFYFIHSRISVISGNVSPPFRESTLLLFFPFFFLEHAGDPFFFLKCQNNLMFMFYMSSKCCTLLFCILTIIYSCRRLMGSDLILWGIS